jgi:hypothetical protein
LPATIVQRPSPGNVSIAHRSQRLRCSHGYQPAAPDKHPRIHIHGLERPSGSAKARLESPPRSMTSKVSALPPTDAEADMAFTPSRLSQNSASPPRLLHSGFHEQLVARRPFAGDHLLPCHISTSLDVVEPLLSLPLQGPAKSIAQQRHDQRCVGPVRVESGSRMVTSSPAQRGWCKSPRSGTLGSSGSMPGLLASPQLRIRVLS